ncbi:MAG: glycosyltransferase family 2 protein [Phycisphaerales bacterium]|nr:MAG: glycosyltransferase family 2 protein [Phycisphaerales bacterium]
MFVTISIQTYNNANVLRQTLQSLAGLECPEGVEYEILVVDNNSDDETATVIRQSEALLGSRLRSVFETKQGLSHARNRAIAEARGEIICFMDDDALVDSRWLAEHVRAYRDHPQAVAVGGRVVLQWPDGWTRPQWLSADLDGYLSGVDLGLDGHVMRYPRYPFGCNMSVRRDIAEQIEGFSIKLGRKKSSLVSNEEKHFFHKIHEMGGQVIYMPTALVHHMVPATRLSRKFFLRRGYAQGISNVLFQTETNPGNGVLRWYVRQVAVGMRLLGEATVGAAGCCLSRSGSARFSRAVRITYCLGYLVEAAKGAGRRLWSRQR